MHVFIETSSDVLVVAPVIAAWCRNRDSSTLQLCEREQPAVLANGRKVPSVREVKQAVDALELFFGHRVADPLIGAAPVLR